MLGKSTSRSVKASCSQKRYCYCSSWSIIQIYLLEVPIWVQAPVTSFASNPWEVCLDLGWTMVDDVNGVATQIRSRNHIYSAFVEGQIFTRAYVWSLGMGIGRCQAPNPTRPVGRPPLIVFQILISSKSPLICYSKLTHTLTCIYHPNMANVPNSSIA